MQPCPSLQTWQDFLVGKLSDAEISDAETHLSHCSVCTSLVAALDSASDPVLGVVRRSLELAHESAAELNALVAIVSSLQATVAGDQSDTAARELVGSSLGQYELLRKLGEGGMGQVYMARHSRLKRNVAVKVIAAKRLRSSAALARFHREMEAAGRLDHLHIARALDAGDNDGWHFLVMEYIDGLNVSQLMQRQGTLAVADACEIIRQAALGLQHAHDAGLIHRDVKPSNLMLSIDGNVKVLDLGLAQFRIIEIASIDAVESTASDPTSGLTHVGQIVGSPDYMAPEQCQANSTTDVRSDIYSLGCTFFQLLAGRPPFSAEFAAVDQKLKAHRETPAVDVKKLRPDVPAEVSSLVARMLAKSPADRPQSAAEVASQLKTLARGANLAGLMSSVAAKPLTLTPAHNRTYVLAAGLILLVVALVAAGIFFGPRFRPIAQQPVPQPAPDKLPIPPEPMPQAETRALSPSDLGRTRIHILESNETFLTPALNGRMLLVDGRSLRVLDSTGTEVKAFFRWERPYRAIYERPTYFIGLAERAVHLINKQNGETLSIASFPVTPLHAMVIHPRQAKSYLSSDSPAKDREFPAQFQILELDEAALKARALPGVFGRWLAIDAEGSRLFTAANETDQAAAHDVVIAYDLTSSPIAERSRNDGPGEKGQQLRMSDDGKSVSYVAADPGHGIVSLDSTDLQRETARYGIEHSPRDLAYHPVLDLVACANDDRIEWFERSTGRAISNRLSLEGSFSEIRQIHFSPDGAHLLVVQGGPAVGGRRIAVLDLQLSATERAAISGAQKP